MVQAPQQAVTFAAVAPESAKKHPTLLLFACQSCGGRDGTPRRQNKPGWSGGIRHWSCLLDRLFPVGSVDPCLMAGAFDQE